MLSTGCIARRICLIGFGVTARLTARPGCIARRTPRGTNKRERKPTNGDGRPVSRFFARSSPGVGARRRAPRGERGSPVRRACQLAPRSLRDNQRVEPWVRWVGVGLAVLGALSAVPDSLPSWGRTTKRLATTLFHWALGRSLPRTEHHSGRLDLSGSGELSVEMVPGKVWSSSWSLAEKVNALREAVDHLGEAQRRNAAEARQRADDLETRLTNESRRIDTRLDALEHESKDHIVTSQRVNGEAFPLIACGAVLAGVPGVDGWFGVVLLVVAGLVLLRFVAPYACRLRGIQL